MIEATITDNITDKPKIGRMPQTLYDYYCHLRPFREDLIEKIKASKSQSLILSLNSIRGMIGITGCNGESKDTTIKNESFFTNLISVMCALGFRIYKTVEDGDGDFRILVALDNYAKFGQLPPFYKKRSEKLVDYLNKIGKPIYTRS